MWTGRSCMVSEGCAACRHQFLRSRGADSLRPAALCFADVSRGTMGIYHSVGVGGDNDGGPTVSINCWPLITHQGSYAPNYTNGVDLVVSPVQQLPAHLLDLKAKTRSRLHYQMAQLAAAPLGRVDPVLMDPDVRANALFGSPEGGAGRREGGVEGGAG